MDVVEQLWLLKQIYRNGRYYDQAQSANLHHIPPSITDSALAALTQGGHAPNNLLRIDHDAILNELKCYAGAWSMQQAVAVFVAGLWTAPILWQSALTGKLLADRMPAHAFTPYSNGTNVCRICGLKHGETVDVSLEWFFCMTSGTSLDGNPVGYVVALREMDKNEVIPVANAYDRWTFRAILTVLRNLPPKTRYSKASEALRKEGLLPTKRKETYNALLETLALIGVLATPEYPGLATAFTTYCKRDERPNIRVEVQAPLAWWDSSIGLNEAVLQAVFADFDCSDVSLSERPQPVVAIKQTVTGSLECKRMPIERIKSAAGQGPVQAGDVYAVRIREGVWVTVYCHALVAGRARVEYLDGVFDHMPAEDELKLSFRPRKDGRWQSNMASMDATSWVKRVASNVPTPMSALPIPDRIPNGGAKELKFLADWCFDEL